MAETAAIFGLSESDASRMRHALQSGDSAASLELARLGLVGTLLAAVIGRFVVMGSVDGAR